MPDERASVDALEVGDAYAASREENGDQDQEDRHYYVERLHRVSSTISIDTSDGDADPKPREGGDNGDASSQHEEQQVPTRDKVRHRSKSLRLRDGLVSRASFRIVSPSPPIPREPKHEREPQGRQ